MGTQWRNTSVRALGCVCLLAVTAGPVVGQRIERGAVAGGTLGAVAAGLFGAWVTRGTCDAADCSDAWIEGVVPGTVFGGLAGPLSAPRSARSPGTTGSGGTLPSRWLELAL